MYRKGKIAKQANKDAVDKIVYSDPKKLATEQDNLQKNYKIYI